MDYALIILSVVMFGGCFALKDAYQKRCGSSFKISLWFTVQSTIPGLLALLLLNGFHFEFTPFTLLMAAISAINSILFSFFSFQALGRINLSLYSLFSMLGGMMLPFLQGLFFYGEEMTWGKGICLVLIVAALLCTLKKGEKRRGGFVFYIGVFILNGMSGVLSKIFTDAPYEKTGPAGFSMLSALCTIVIAGVLLLILLRRGEPLKKPTLLTFGISASSGVVNRVANYFLVIALAHGIDSSIQYPMVTGGVMIVSTIIAFFGKNKPSRREVLSVALAFLGLLLLFLIPV